MIFWIMTAVLVVVVLAVTVRTARKRHHTAYMITYTLNGQRLHRHTIQTAHLAEAMAEALHLLQSSPTISLVAPLEALSAKRVRLGQYRSIVRIRQSGKILNLQIDFEAI